MELNGLAELIGAVWGVGTSIVFKVVPPLDRWLYTKVSDDYRGLVMLALSLVVPLGFLLVSCVGLYPIVPCTTEVWKDLVRAWLSFVVANVGIFLMTGDSKEKKLRKARLTE